MFLIGIERFIYGFESQYKKCIPNNVKKAIRLFWGNHSEIENILKINSYDIDYETRKHRLTATTLEKYDKTLLVELINWFKENIYFIADFCFSRGLAKNKKEWSDIIWYINDLDTISFDKLFYIKDICVASEKFSDGLIKYGTKNGGTTIKLPFGFVQWHSPSKEIPGSLQFHHSLESIMQIVD